MTRFNRCRKVGVVALGSAMFGLGGLTGASINAVPTSAALLNHFTCNASALRVEGTGLPIGTIEPLATDPTQCTTTDAGLLSIPLPTGTGDHVSVLTASTTDDEPPAEGSVGTATANAGVLDVQIGGTLLQARVLTSHAEENQVQQCDPNGHPVNRTGDSDVATVVIGGTTIQIPTAKSTPSSPTLAIPGLLTLWLREEIVGPDSLTERALELQTPLVNVVVAESRVDHSISLDPTQDPCKRTPPPKCVKEGSNPPVTDTDEQNPFVDPTAMATKGKHPDCVPEFSVPKGNGPADGQDYVHFVRDINDTETSPNGAFVPRKVVDSRNRFNGDAGFREDGALKATLEGKFYDDEDMKFRLAPKTLDAYFAPNDLAASPWRRFCGTGTIEKFGSDDPATMTTAEKMASPAAPFKVGDVRKFLVETFDAKWLNPDNPGGDQSDYWVIDIYKPGSSFDTKACDPVPGGHDHGENENPFKAGLDYHSEGQTIAGNIQIHSDRFLRPS